MCVCLCVSVCLPVYWFLTYWDQRYWMIEWLITTYRSVCVNIQWYISHVVILTVPIGYILHTHKMVMFKWNVFVNRNMNNSTFSLSRTWAFIMGNEVHDTSSLSYETYKRTHIHIYRNAHILLYAHDSSTHIDNIMIYTNLYIATSSEIAFKDKNTL